MASGYVIGGLIPLAPYLFAATVAAALPQSIVLTLTALLVFGYIKGRYTSARPVKSALETVLVGGLAAAAAFLIARAIS
ncbi:MAG: VIT1/CCC1 transporter family protein [Pyrinomonadaceae bacterium]